MVKTYSIRLPDAIAKALDAMAKAEGNKPTTLATFVIERYVRERMEQKAASFPHQVTDPSTVQELIQTNLGRILAVAVDLSEEEVNLILAGNRPTGEQIIAIAAAISIDTKELLDLVKTQYDQAQPKQNGNNIHSKTP